MSGDRTPAAECWRCAHRVVPGCPDCRPGGLGVATPADPPRPDAHDRFCDGTCKRKERGRGWMCPDPYGPGRALLSGGEQK